MWPRAVREKEATMKKTVKPLKVRRLTIDRETLRTLVRGAENTSPQPTVPVPVPFSRVSCVVSQCANTCTNIFETCA